MNLVNLNTLSKYQIFKNIEVSFVDDFGWASVRGAFNTRGIIICGAYRKTFIKPLQIFMGQ